jgi:hypothetical protein
MTLGGGTMTVIFGGVWQLFVVGHVFTGAHLKWSQNDFTGHGAHFSGQHSGAAAGGDVAVV